MSSWRTVWSAWVAVVVASMVIPAVHGGCTLASGMIEHGGGRFEWYVPSTDVSLLPLVVVWHGIASNPTQIEEKTQFKLLADEHGVAVVYPVGVGTPPSFNGAGCCSAWSIGTERDDVAFAREIIVHVSETHACVDPHAVFTAGFSNGGFMSHRLACEAGFRLDGRPWFRAFASHSGLRGAQYVCPHGQGRVPYLAFHADDDAVVGIDGSGLVGTPFTPLSYLTGDWVVRNGCLHQPLVHNASATTTCTDWGSCGVLVCVVHGLRHNWSGDPRLRASRPDDLHASRTIVDFFLGVLDPRREKS